MKKRKEYDAVAEVRKIREELSLKYWGNHDLLFERFKRSQEKVSPGTRSATKALTPSHSSFPKFIRVLV
ncbi:hypothetical protein [Chitinophaga sp. 212800010-3]|uniref:hypothetical protein n=1 Tax=unclassified Chitinophaga TaxID=2619133 RepID=UPI002DE5BA0E|nr:hypothetical protein [Chitinophaga sp. 212800010-3]